MSGLLPVLAGVMRELKQTETDKVEYVSLGNCKTYEEYQKLCGEIRGLVYAQNLLQDLVRKLELNE